MGQFLKTNLFICIINIYRVDSISSGSPDRCRHPAARHWGEAGLAFWRQDSLDKVRASRSRPRPLTSACPGWTQTSLGGCPRHLRAKDTHRRPRVSPSPAEAAPKVLTQPATIDQNKPRAKCLDQPLPRPHGPIQGADPATAGPVERASRSPKEQRFHFAFGDPGKRKSVQLLTANEHFLVIASSRPSEAVPSFPGESVGADSSHLPAF